MNLFLFALCLILMVIVLNFSVGVFKSIVFVLMMN